MHPLLAKAVRRSSIVAVGAAAAALTLPPVVGVDARERPLAEPAAATHSYAERPASREDAAGRTARRKARKSRSAAGHRVRGAALRRKSARRKDLRRRRGRARVRASIKGGIPRWQAAAPPEVKTLPVISGTAQAGQSLTASTGSWSGSPASYQYQWLRCDSGGSSCAAISGATTTTYALGAGDVGSTVRVRVTATNAFGSTGATSVQTPVVTAAPTEPAPPPPPPAPEPTPTPSPTGVPVPAPIAGQGYSPVFSDEFDTFNARLDGVEDDSKKWNTLWYRSAVPAGAVTVANSVLSLNSRRSDGFPDLAISTRRATQAGSSAWTYGYFEARMRWTGTQGHWPAFWLLHLKHAFLGEGACPALNSELDIFEGQGSQPRRVYTALHRNTANRCGVANTFKPTTHWWDTASNTTGTWHTFAALWTPTAIKWYFDDQLINETTPYDSTHAPMFVILQSDSGGWMGGPDATTADNLVTEFDWVRVWQK